MEKYEFEVLPQEGGGRIDLYLAKKFPKPISRSAIQELIREGKVLVNKKIVKCHYKVKEGDIILAEIIPQEKIEIVPQDILLEIVFEDDCLVVVNKPTGLLVHPAPGFEEGTLVNALLFHFQKLSHLAGEFKPGIVHRLDRDTSGLLVVAKTDEAHLALAEQFRNHTIFRKYIAFVEGKLELDEGTVDLPLGRHPRNREKRAINFSNGKTAITHYKVTRRYQDFTLIEVYPKTGRTHQIRVHMAYIGHPILGDRVYGRPSDLITRQALHATSLGFKHPITGKYHEFHSEVPEDIKKLM